MLSANEQIISCIYVCIQNIFSLCGLLDNQCSNLWIDTTVFLNNQVHFKIQHFLKKSGDNSFDVFFEISLETDQAFHSAFVNSQSSLIGFLFGIFSDHFFGSTFGNLFSNDIENSLRIFFGIPFALFSGISSAVAWDIPNLFIWKFLRTFLRELSAIPVETLSATLL